MSADLPNEFDIKRDGLTAHVYRGASGQWAWRLMDAAGTPLCSGAGYDDEGDAASEAQHALEQEAGTAKATDEATPSSRDAQRALRDVDALVQSETRATEIILHMVGNALAQIAAEKTDKQPPCRQRDIQSLAIVARDCAMRIAQLRDLVNGEAEAVGCNWTDSAGESADGD
ncbi:MAG: hypothetical protein AB7S55_02945 [Thiomonas sp.]|jgi:hypothetical protein